MHERCTQLMSDWDTDTWRQYRTLQTAQHCIYSRYLHPEKAPPLSLSKGVNTHWWNGTHRSSCWLLTTTYGWTWNSQKEEKKAKQSYKIFPTGGSRSRAQSCRCPHKHRSRPSLYLPGTQVCGRVCSQPRCGPEQVRVLVLLQIIWGGSEGRYGSIRLGEPFLMDKGCCVEGQNASLQHTLPTLVSSMKPCHPHLGKKTLRVAQLASNLFFPVKPITRTACIYSTVNGPNKEKKHSQDTAPLLQLWKKKSE